MMNRQDELIDALSSKLEPVKPVRHVNAMALAWVLRDGGITTALIGASRPEQVSDCVGAIGNLEFSAEDLAEIDRYADEENINLWAKSSETTKGAAQR